MQLPLQIAFRNVDSSAAVEAYVRERAEKLDKFYDRIMACRVVIEVPHRHHHKGNLYRARIDLTVPDGELVFSKEPGDEHAHEDIYVAIRDAFDGAQRQLEDYVRRRRGHVKTHEIPNHGHITELHLEDGFGRIQTTDGKEIYFHRNSVVNAPFESLTLGTDVRFTEEAGDSGPQASTVQVIGKHPIVG
ncbi:MAG: HPF/RaiA family ribosome-associated protein [Gammaproteobacteria bacterium]|jgi:ribosomal subunit interface protein